MRRAQARAQGATEYLLILAVVLVIVAAVVLFLTTTTPQALVSGTATISGDNILFTPSSEMTPSTIAQADWQYAVYRDATVVVSFTAGTADLKRGETIQLPATGASSGDVLKIKYKDKDVFNISVS
ncbi:MAG: hypothetical protein QMD00_03070 [Hadesarchaea archaeon]|nr:hypothetical protein [Hadesarchaea archaeon]